MKTQKKTRETLIAIDTPLDYTAGMFADGNNRAAHLQSPAYDKAARTVDPELAGEVVDMNSQQLSDTTFHSRDGSDASGRDDEDGGHLGGTEEELDSLEAGGTPVDKNPRMK